MQFYKFPTYLHRAKIINFQMNLMLYFTARVNTKVLCYIKNKNK